VPNPSTSPLSKHPLVILITALVLSSALETACVIVLGGQILNYVLRLPTFYRVFYDPFVFRTILRSVRGEELHQIATPARPAQ
jgi:hypothetical protein